MKKILTYLLDVLTLLVLALPAVGFLALKGLTWLSEKSVDIVDLLRKKFRLDPGDSPEWTYVAEEWLLKIMN